MGSWNNAWNDHKGAARQSSPPKPQLYASRLQTNITYLSNTWNINEIRHVILLNEFSNLFINNINSRCFILSKDASWNLFLFFVDKVLDHMPVIRGIPREITRTILTNMEKVDGNNGCYKVNGHLDTSLRLVVFISKKKWKVLKEKKLKF